MASQTSHQADPGAQEDHTNQLTAAYFAASILGFLVLLTSFHLLGLALQSDQRKIHGPFTKRVILTTRFARSMLLRKVPGFTSLGHAFVFIIYLVINLSLIFQNVNLTGPSHLAKRMGWITACNIALVTFLALKNTPLGFLVAYSYERLNILHQAAGYCTIFAAILHGLLMVISAAQLGYLSAFFKTTQIMGIVAGLSMMTILTTAIFLKNLRYEIFYIVHIIMFMLILIAVAMHRPNLSDETVYIIIFTASIWAADRLFRISRMMMLAIGNSATVTPLGHNGIRISMSRTPWRAISGSHVFLWIPKLRFFEAHPFTIVSQNPLVLVVSAKDGFTKNLLSYAITNPGAILRASCDGPYGALPNFSRFDQVVLIAGGSGASFTFGVALRLLHQMETSRFKSKINFIWVIRTHEMKTWFAKELSKLSASPYVTITLYITQSISAACATTSNNDKDNKEILNSYTPSLSEPDLEKTMTVFPKAVSTSESNMFVVSGRPDIDARIRDITDCTEAYKRTIVAACGPSGLMMDTRRAVAAIMANQDTSITLHCEQFGW